MKNFILLLAITVFLTFSSCRTDFDTVASSGNLEFSKTKIYLDTVFNNIGSSTYGLKVYNRSNSDIKIPLIKLGKGLTSRYRMMVDGMTGNQGKIFNDVELLAKDSLFIFIEITNVDPNPAVVEFTYDDQILFDVGANEQKVDLTTLIWDAKFIFPNRTLNPTDYEKVHVNEFDADITAHNLNINDFDPAKPWTFTKDKPYVIYGNCIVPNGHTLTIEAGARLYFHANATLIVDETATLIINGGSSTTTINNEVTFEGDRLEPDFEDVPGQWGAVFILSNTNNRIKNLKLKNAVVGLYMRNLNAPTPIIPKLELLNSQFYGCSNYGVLALNSNIIGKNSVINSAGQACFAGVLGGNYYFNHCTFNNDWSSSSQRAVFLQDYYEDNTGVHASIPAVNFKNCIIYGKTNSVELELKYNFTTAPNFDHCLIKFNDTNTTFANKTIYNSIRTGNPANVNANITSPDPKFKNTSKNKLMPLTITSGAYRKAVYDPDIDLNNDIGGNARSTSVSTPRDIGAYNVIP